MAKLTTDEIIDALKEMTLLEASELVKAIEDTFGVSAAAPAAVVAGKFFIGQSAYFSRSGSACPAASESSFKDVSNGCIIV